MNYTSELRRLGRLLRADYRSFLAELDKPWSGMDEDLDLAVQVLLKHAAKSRGHIPLLAACNFPEDPGQDATVTLPEWWFEIITAFGDLYEPAEAEYRGQKVLNELIGKQLEREAPATYH